MKVVYICGPFRAKTTWGIERNTRRAEEAALVVAELGMMPLCPHTNTRFFHGLLTEKFWLDGTAELLTRCNAMFRLHGWETSEGSRSETVIAQRQLIPIFDRISELEIWKETQ